MCTTLKCFLRSFPCLAVAILCMMPIQLKSQLAEGQSKFLGNIISGSVPPSFNTYWNQVTPENGGKWGVVESNRDQMDWTALDRAYNHARDNGYPFKQHTFIWGSQYPSQWLDGLSSSQQLEEIIEWIDAYTVRYAQNTAFIDVVNEPLHQPPPFKNALGGDNNLYGTGWDWVVRSFELVRDRMPDAKLLINEYGIIGNPTEAQNYRNIIDILNSRGLIDGIGIQCHAFNMDGVSVSTMNNALNVLAGAGLPIYVSELDMNATNGNTNLQLSRYQEKFPVLWEHPSVAGITLWGYVQNQIWQTEAWLLSSSGSERPALQWLRDYLQDNPPPTGDEHIWLEAECGTVGSLWNTNSDGSASNGSYVTIQSGNNSTGSAPSNTNGHINYDFTIDEGGTYIVWGRVIAPNGSDDSFWVRMDGGSWFQWNNIGTGSSWGWDDVHDTNNGGQTVNFNLNNGSHTLTVAYREDGTQLDKIYITNSGNVPMGTGSSAANCTAPTLSVSPTSLSFGSGSGSSNVTVTSNINWSVTDNQSWISVSPTSGSNNGSLTVSVTSNGSASSRNGMVTVSGSGLSQNISVSQSGTTVGDDHVWLEAECGSVGSLWNTNSDGSASNGSYVTIQSGNNSTGSAPTNTNGHINYNFNVTANDSYTLWARVIAPTPTDDSFWIRMDGGSWIQWNNIAPGSTSWTWDDVQSFNLSPGSHTLTVAYREDGTQLDKLYITNSSDVPSGQGGAANNCTTGGGTIVVRALGTSGNETIELRIDDNTVETWSLSTSFQNFTHNTSTSSGNIKVYFNDSGGEGFDVQVDFIQTNGATLQAEDQATNTGVWQNSACGGSFSEMIHCEGYIDFGTVSIGKQAFADAAEEVTPGDFALRQNYPNPFNPETEISYQLKDAGTVRLEIFNILGNKIRTLVNKTQNAGIHTVRWNGKNESGTQVSSGVYVYTLEAVTSKGTLRESRKMLLAK